MPVKLVSNLVLEAIVVEAHFALTEFKYRLCVESYGLR